jgi:hypothetical protein
MTRKLMCAVAIAALVASCSKDSTTAPQPKDPNTSAKVSVDRFSDGFANLFRRSGNAALPAANAAVNFDAAPFITRGLGPTGQSVWYYNFDVLSTVPDEIYVFFKAGATSPIAGQLNIINTIPGDQGYNDFWRVVKVIVPDNYVANTITSEDGINSAGYTKEQTTIVVNCPVVPEGSTANLRMNGAATGLTRGWYKDKVVSYFEFGEKALNTTATGMVPLSPIYVTFSINPNLPNGGPGSGFRTEPGTDKTHNVVATIPSDAAYSPLWTVKVYDNANFNSVTNLTTAVAATILNPAAATVNCPVVRVQ